MSAAGIKVATTTTNARKAAGIHEDGVNKNNEKTTTNETDCALITDSGEENSSFCTLPSLKELQTSFYHDANLQNNGVPLENSKQNAEHLSGSEVENSHTLPANFKDLEDFPKGQLRQGDVETTTQLCPGLSLLQQTAAASSPPPHSYRHSRAYRHFKNPPQPHMCIRTTTEAGEELFINVLSWTRIVIPQEPSDPIPLYGGMRVPPGSPRSPPIVFAVMANPEVLKDSGRHSKDPEERRAMVELMCDFVEAMNPGVKLVRNAIILKDRDISGELKDVWNAVQAQRDREREEQILLQRQQHQQHFHNITNPSTNGSSISNSSLNSSNNSSIDMPTTQQMFSKSVMSDDSISKTVAEITPPRNRKNIPEVQNDNTSNIDLEKDIEKTNNCQVSLNLLAEHLNNKMSIAGTGETNEGCIAKQQSNPNNQNALTNDALNNGNNKKDSIEMERIEKGHIINLSTALNCKKDLKNEHQTNGSVLNCYKTEMSNSTKVLDTSTSPNSAQNPPTNVTPLSTTPAKKEKLGGFLPNGCIFPRFTKNNKHKDKDKEKEPKTKEKEKNALLSALKKSKDKKSNAAANLDEKNTSSNSKITADTYNNPNTKQQKNCLQQLECGVQKLDLNNHHHINIVENNINNSEPILANKTTETNKNTSSTITNSDNV